jgi:type I restriction enzyme M protein
MTRYFYEYKAPESVETIVTRINALEKEITDSLNALFPKEV